MAESMEDRRLHPRFDTRFELQGSAEDGGTVARMVASNLSLGGLYCTSTQDYPEMTRLAIRLMLPEEGAAEEQPVDLEAVVVRRRELPATAADARYELALFFTSVTDSVRDQLEAFLGATQH